RFTRDGLFLTFRFSPDGSQALLPGPNAVTLYHARSGAETQRLPAKWRWSDLAAFAPDGRSLAIGGSRKPLELWDLRTSTARALSQPMVPLCYLPDGSLLAVTSAAEEAGALVRWDFAGDRELARLGTVGGPAPFALAPDGKALALAR